MAKHTQTHWGLMCRDVCEDWLIAHFTQIGGITIDGNRNFVPKIVEIDVSCFTKSQRSYNQCVTPSFWLFGEFLYSIHTISAAYVRMFYLFLQVLMSVALVTAFWLKFQTKARRHWSPSSQNGFSPAPEFCLTAGPAITT